jgi:prepilin signal peptidase PulO-like enzyme (type II secretory pathway)
VEWWLLASVVISTSLVTVGTISTGDRSPAAVVAVAGCAVVLATLAAIDARTHRLPNQLIYPALVVVLVGSVFRIDLSLANALAAAAVASLPYFIAFELASRVRPRHQPEMRDGARDDRASRGQRAALVSGIAGAIVMLALGVTQAGQAALGAMLAASVAGCPFLMLLIADLLGASDTERPDPPRGVGGGDVKMAALVGAIAGAPTVLAALPVAALGGAAGALIAALIAGGRSRAIPYGPFLAGGAVLALV